MTYKYESPKDKGFTRVRLPRKAHNNLFPQRQFKWTRRYEYYLSADRFVVHELPSLLAQAITVLMFPLVVVGEGIFNWKDIIDTYKKMLQPKRHGAFVEEVVWCNSDKFKIIKDEVSST